MSAVGDAGQRSRQQAGGGARPEDSPGSKCELKAKLGLKKDDDMARASSSRAPGAALRSRRPRPRPAPSHRLAAAAGAERALPAAPAERPQTKPRGWQAAGPAGCECGVGAGGGDRRGASARWPRRRRAPGLVQSENTGGSARGGGSLPGWGGTETRGRGTGRLGGARRRAEGRREVEGHRDWGARRLGGARRREEGGPAGWRTRRRGEWDTETQDGEGVGGAGGHGDTAANAGVGTVALRNTKARAGWPGTRPGPRSRGRAGTRPAHAGSEAAWGPAPAPFGRRPRWRTEGCFCTPSAPVPRCDNRIEGAAAPAWCDQHRAFRAGEAAPGT